MARKKRSYRRARSAGSYVKRRATRSYRSKSPDVIGNVGAGAAAGVVASLASKYVGNQFGPALGMGGVGYLANNATLMTIAGVNLARLIPVGGNGGTSGGGYI